MSDFTSAWGELFAAQTESIGSTTQATVGAVTANAVVSELDFDAIIAEGGIGESGGYELQMLVSAFGSRPVKNSAVTVYSDALFVLKVRTNNGIYYITAGDPASQD